MLLGRGNDTGIIYLVDVAREINTDGLERLLRVRKSLFGGTND